MSATEIAFLAFGLVLGVASGIGLAVVIRSRPSSPRQVRLTIAPGSVAVRRAQTLAAAELRDESAAAFGTPVAEPRTAVRSGEAPASSPVGTTLGESAGGPASSSGTGSLPPMPSSLAGPRTGDRPTIPATAIGIPIDTSATDGPGLAEQLVAARRAPRVEEATEDAATRPPFRLDERPLAKVRRVAAPGTSPPSASAGRPGPGAPGHKAAGGEASASAAADRPRAGEVPRRESTAGLGSSVTPAPADAGPCAEARQLADERCSIAELARTAAKDVLDRLMAARREYDDHRRRLEAAEAQADPRAVRDAKDAAQQRFRTSRGGGDATEEAARGWLREINRINTAAREALAVVEKERIATQDLVPRLDRLELEADAARIAAESAEATCREARDAWAQCEEAARQTSAPAAPSWAPDGPADLATPLGSGEAGGALAVGGDGQPVILRLVRGDRAALERMVSTLGGADPVDRRQWQHRLTDLVDAIVARAIEAAYLDFPEDHRFWGSFARSQGRDIVAALASLGFRFDGLGGWVDERIPTQRDLSLAVGYAGLDPMRIRHWPTEPELAELMRTAFVAADEWLAGAAGELTLGEMIDALGRRADDLAEVWNDWGRVRPALLATD